MARATTDELRGILGTTALSEEDLQQLLEEGFSFLEGHLSGVGHSEDRLRLMEIRYAAAAVAVREPATAGLLRRERKGDQEREFAIGRRGSDMTETMHWQIMLGLDTTGTLRRMDKLKPAEEFDSFAYEVDGFGRQRGQFVGDRTL